MANEHNLIPLNKRSKSVQREIQEKGRQANKEKWAEKLDARARMKAVLEAAADPRVAAALAKTGIEVEDNMDVLIAGLMKGVIKGDIKAIEKALELSGQSRNAEKKAKKDDIEIRKAEAEAARAEMETELYKLRLEAIKGIGQEDIPDDGFLDALKDKAAEDWSNDVL